MIEKLEENRIDGIMKFVEGMSFESVLDVGCGTGILTSKFSKLSKLVYGIDKNEKEINEAKEKYKDLNNVNFTVVDLEKNGFKGNMDLIIFSDVIYYLTKDTQKRIMENIFFVLNEGGYFITSRHMGQDDEEINEYTNLFEKIKTHWITYTNNQNKGWWITLWRKKNGMCMIRSNDEINSEINKILNSNSVSFEALGALYWCLHKDVKVIINTVNDYMTNFDSQKSMDMLLAMLWCLQLEKDKKSWIKFQEMYHTWHDKCKEPDFRVPIILKWIGKGKKILDLGVHNGIQTNEFAKENDVTGVDLPKVVERFKNEYKFPVIVLDISEGLKPFKDEEFDCLIAGEIIEHILKPEKLFKEIHRVLKKDGMLIISCPYRDLGSHDPLHCHEIDEQWFLERFVGLFKIVDIKDELKEEKKCLIFKAVKI